LDIILYNNTLEQVLRLNMLYIQHSPTTLLNIQNDTHQIIQFEK